MEEEFQTRSMKSANYGFGLKHKHQGDGSLRQCHVSFSITNGGRDEKLLKKLESALLYSFEYRLRGH